MEPILHTNIQKRKRNSPKVNLIIAIVFHAILFAVGAWWAAHEGIFGSKLQELTLMLVPKEKHEEAKKEEEKTEVKREEPKAAETKAPVTPRANLNVPPPPANLPVAEAPPPAALSDFHLGGFGFADAATTYAAGIEKTIRARWEKPQGVEDLSFVAEIKVHVDSSGKLLSYDWVKGSNNKTWDDSVRLALDNTKNLGVPPKNFPQEFVVRFDVQKSSETILSQSPN